MIKVEKLSITIQKHQILKGISYHFKRNEFICIIGQNGSGKSTLLRTLSGYLSYQGCIYVNGNNLTELSKKEKAKIISYLPQNRTIPYINVIELISHGRFPHLSFSKTLTNIDHKKIMEAIEITGVKSLLERQVPTLSGGERQRVYIAMMLAQDADVLLLDEPVTFLDIKHQIEVLDLLKRLHNKGKTIIMVAHDLAQAFSYSSQIILLSNGKIVLDGCPQTVFEDKRIKENFGISLICNDLDDELYKFQLRK